MAGSSRLAAFDRHCKSMESWVVTQNVFVAAIMFQLFVEKVIII
jgi:hypothetical protein